jgi:hypothetical protein
MPAAASTSTDVAAMRVRYDRAPPLRAAPDIGMWSLVNRWHSDTLLAVDGQPAAARIEILRRMSILFEVWVNRRSWPATIRGWSAR